MYLQTGFGRPPTPQLKDELVETCFAWVLNVPFKIVFNDFRQEVLNAINRHVADQINRKMVPVLLVKQESWLKMVHQSLQKQSTELKQNSNNVPVKATLFYTVGKNRKLWRITFDLLGGFWTEGS
jgi:hypothetical protein